VSNKKNYLLYIVAWFLCSIVQANSIQLNNENVTLNLTSGENSIGISLTLGNPVNRENVVLRLNYR
jgi:hypothetical protein